MATRDIQYSFGWRSMIRISTKQETARDCPLLELSQAAFWRRTWRATFDPIASSFRVDAQVQGILDEKPHEPACGHDS